MVLQRLAATLATQQGPASCPETSCHLNKHSVSHTSLGIKPNPGIILHCITPNTHHAVCITPNTHQQQLPPLSSHRFQLSLYPVIPEPLLLQHLRQDASSWKPVPRQQHALPRQGLIVLIHLSHWKFERGEVV